jgi:hypothetical protein
VLAAAEQAANDDLDHRTILASAEDVASHDRADGREREQPDAEHHLVVGPGVGEDGERSEAAEDRVVQRGKGRRVRRQERVRREGAELAEEQGPGQASL